MEAQLRKGGDVQVYVRKLEKVREDNGVLTRSKGGERIIKVD